jgi:phenylpropionate dioxygenase-like ring-hydroxylating dioxygenase large terminal subunit
MILLKDFWYIACESRSLKRNTVLHQRILDEWIVLFRDETGKAVALRDICLHRQSRLSAGRVRHGCLVCPYHGWTYNGLGQVVHIPSDGPEFLKTPRFQTQGYETQEWDDYVYLRLNESPEKEFPPFRITPYKEKGFHTVRVRNHFHNNVLRCAENFVNIPHTVFVHPGIFRVARYEKLQASVTRIQGKVHTEYRNETSNLGIFSRFLNPSQQEIFHTDTYYFPNITRVEYRMGSNRHFIITSQSIPIQEDETLVYTDLTYNYGLWNRLAAPLIRWHAQTIIHQDRRILKNQMESLKKYGESPKMSQADLLFKMMQTLWESFEQGQNPHDLPEKQLEMEFWI